MRTINSLVVASLMPVLLLSSARAETPGVTAQTTIEKIRAKGFVQCGTALRPGLAAADSEGHWSGLNFEICRAIAIAVLGPKARFAIHHYRASDSYDPLRSGEDDVGFLTFEEMRVQNLTGVVLAGLPVFIETHDVLVAGDSKVQHADGLAGLPVCFDNTRSEEASLEAWVAEKKVPVLRSGFSESGEMYDAFDVQRCKAVVGESTTLAAHRTEANAKYLNGRLLPEHLATIPVVIATPLKADAQWAAVVDWTLRTLMVADAHETTFRPDGIRALDIDGAAFGLAKDWQKQLIAVTGSYSAMFDRNLGAGSPLKLEPGLNAPALDGHILMSYPAR